MVFELGGLGGARVVVLHGMQGFVVYERRRGPSRLVCALELYERIGQRLVVKPVRRKTGDVFECYG